MRRLSRLQLQTIIGVMLLLGGVGLVAAAATPLWVAWSWLPRTPVTIKSPGDDLFEKVFAAPFVIGFIGGPLVALAGAVILIVTGIQALTRRTLAVDPPAGSPLRG